MGQQPLNIKMLKLRLLAEFKADKKKATILSLLLLVAVIVGLRFVMQYKSPESAEASTINTPLTEVANQAHRVVKNQAIQSQDRLAEHLKKQKSEIDRDIFAVNSSYFTLQKTVEIPKAQPTSAPTPAEDIKEKQRKAILAQAASLTLESTMLGQTSVAVINGKILHIGEYFSGFRVVDIAASRCRLVKNEVTVTLEIKK